MILAQVIFNGHTYVYDNILEAIEVCFRLCTALYCWTEIADYIWAFITECIYKIKPDTEKTEAFVPKSYMPISTFVAKINAYDSL